MCVALLGCSAAAQAADPGTPAANPAEALELPTVTVVGTTPLPGLGAPLEEVPANVQIYTSGDFSRAHATTTDYLVQNAGSVSSNAAQGNPFQPDIAFRGFTASPLLGTPEGLSVFQDGVRVNEPFGDVVNWDLIPQSAISSIQLIPGSNPAFGLNTLGGALAIYTKSGAEYPGGALEVSGGSFGRRTAEFEWGGAHGPLDAFVTGNYFHDDGWADHNPSEVKQLFAKAGWQDAKTDVDLALTAADTALEGTQTLPLSFLSDERQAYTWPDTTANRLALLTLKGSHFLAPAVLLGGNAYYRSFRSSSLDSNVNGDYGQVDPATGAPDLTEGSNNLAQIDEDGFGGGLQLTVSTTGKHANQLTIGASDDAAHSHFQQLTQSAAFTASRETIATGAFMAVTNADTDANNLGLFVADAYHLTPRWTLSASGRYDRAEASIADLSGLAPRLDGTHVFTRFSPAAGVNFNPRPGLTAYAGYSEGMRAPTAIELTCADPSAPCQLPNDFLADPPLAAEVARTLELGARGRSALWQWSGAAYQSLLRNDIEFISATPGASNAGYYANIGATRRLGLELAAATRFGPLAVSARYSFIDATFRSNFSELSPFNSSANASGAILVTPGDRIPSIPRQTFKLRGDYDVNGRFSLGASILVASGVYARGDENNADRNGPLPGFVLVNLDARCRISGNLELFARVNNALDARYYDFGILGENFFTGPDHSFGPAAGAAPVATQFRGPGAPAGVWVGLRYGFGGAHAGAGVED
ncbi:MAG TPA: TonB-dependent receptor [Steroidobacteraceae bacterium]|nr:TonB-dependent receptor [Steroidobacteraceae bacterium]